MTSNVSEFIRLRIGYCYKMRHPFKNGNEGTNATQYLHNIDFHSWQRRKLLPNVAELELKLD